MAVKPVEHAGAWLLPEVHDPATGRIDAKKLAAVLGVKQAELARALRVDRRVLGSKPTLPKLQERAAMLERTLAILIDYLGSAEVARAWFQTPNPNLGDRTPWEVCEKTEEFPKGLEAVAHMIARVPEGIPA